MPTSPFNLTVYSNDGQTVLYNDQLTTSSSDKITITQSGFYSSRTGTVNISYGANIQGWGTTVNASTPTYNIDTQYEGMEIFNSGENNVFYVVLQNKFVSAQGLNVLVNKIKSKQDKITNTNKLDYSLIKNTPTITFDDTPTNGSNNPVKSGGIYTALAGKQNTLVAGTNITIDPTTNTISATGGASITVDSALSPTSKNPVQNKVITSDLSSLSYNLMHKIEVFSSGSNFVKFSNGLIIQWGLTSEIKDKTVTFPTPFTTTTYGVVGFYGTWTGSYANYAITQKTKTNFYFDTDKNCKLNWIAIGN